MHVANKNINEGDYFREIVYEIENKRFYASNY